MHKVTKIALTSLILTPALTAALATPGSASTGGVTATSSSCSSSKFCVWTKKNYKGTKYELSLPGKGKCKNTAYLSRVKKTHVTITVGSFKASSKRGVTAMWTKPNCKGKPSMSYKPGAKVSNAGGFKMQSFD